MTRPDFAAREITGTVRRPGSRLRPGRMVIPGVVEGGVRPRVPVPEKGRDREALGYRTGYMFRLACSHDGEYGKSDIWLNRAFKFDIRCEVRIERGGINRKRSTGRLRPGSEKQRKGKATTLSDWVVKDLNLWQLQQVFGRRNGGCWYWQTMKRNGHCVALWLSPVNR
ncbi:hypothetical protein CALVIDRAFT_340708 [Calocera viscosa TUFC12733]|uniref:Uncharacterized protein n=1 Tax=Calocera viscosa (strain TUFC12733) TaxID=1330018 RepID=A0A167HHW8_CALVF|nr:hypothetical protein CALVIDRAFT_340708 [Calocera viscosa TUFC12733]